MRLVVDNAEYESAERCSNVATMHFYRDITIDCLIRIFPSQLYKVGFKKMSQFVVGVLSYLKFQCVDCD